MRDMGDDIASLVRHANIHRLPVLHRLPLAGGNHLSCICQIYHLHASTFFKIILLRELSQAFSAIRMRIDYKLLARTLVEIQVAPGRVV